VINEPTASTFILRRDRERGWLTALVWHPRLGCWLPAGGHVEPDETPAQAGIREVMEETGLDVTLVPRPAAPLPRSRPGSPTGLFPRPGWSPRCPPPRTGTQASVICTSTTSTSLSPAARAP
jgi:8-oxo-dGTP pyrophosphatase MutT (NUDIX family)